MGLSHESDDFENKRFQEVCADLNMDINSAEEAWQSYKQISTNYTLEGDKMGWLACSMYVACRKSVVPTVSRGNFVEGNCVSLTRLLRSSKLSLIQFFKLMRKWADMANLPPELRMKVDHIERNFAVSKVIFNKFQPIYNDIFRDPSTEPPRPPRSRKQKRLPCASAELFEFCWTTFVKVKANFIYLSDDLVNSYHLLLSIMDLFFANTLIANRQDLLNPKFLGLPSNYGDADYVPPTSPPCIIEILCERHDGLVVEAKSIKEHWSSLHFKKLFNKKILKGKASNFSGLIDPANFEANSKSVNKLYEEFVLSKGDFDERIFLGFDASNEIGTSRMTNSGELSEKIQMKRNTISEHSEITESLSFQTPLTGKRYLVDKDAIKVTPVSTATQSVNKLQTLLSGCKTVPSDNLRKVFKECSRDPADNICNLVKEMGETFSAAYAAPLEDRPITQNDFARQRLQLAESLFYKVLEKIVTNEKKRFENSADLSPLFEQKNCYQSLFACCLEIVLFSYNSQKTFPWIMDIFELSPFHFYKIIEILIRAEDGLSRDVVKNLNHIEEQILESLAWKSESPLWLVIKSVGVPLPSFTEVSLPSERENDQNEHIQSSLLTSPVAHPAVRRLTTGSARKETFSPASPTSTPPNGATYQMSPRLTPTGAKRKLFPSGNVNGSNSSSNSSVLQSPGQTVSITLQTVQGENGVTYLPISSNAIRTAIAAASAGTNQGSVGVEKNASNKSTSPAVTRPKKTGSLALFLRKVYHLTSIRLRDLCDKMGLDSEELKKKIWTSFEYCLMHHTDLMMDRHLDQIMMCTVYVMCKVTGNVKTFQEIMKYYRMQPQAQSHVYRAVLLTARRRNASGSSENSRTENSGSGSNSPISVERDDERSSSKDSHQIRSSSTLSVLQGSAPPTPTRLAGTGSSFEYEDRGDIINFYNHIYVKLVKSFALQFSTPTTENRVDSPVLSTMPLPKLTPMSPRGRRVSNKHSIFVSPLKSANMGRSPIKQLSYSFNKSPRKDLDAINKMVKLKNRDLKNDSVKRVFADNSNDMDQPVKRTRNDVCMLKIQNVINERQSGKVE